MGAADPVHGTVSGDRRRCDALGPTRRGKAVLDSLSAAAVGLELKEVCEKLLTMCFK
jgi:hypothetical protein